MSLDRISMCLRQAGYSIDNNGKVEVNQHTRPDIVESYTFDRLLDKDGNIFAHVWFYIDDKGRCKFNLMGGYQLRPGAGLGGHGVPVRLKNAFEREICHCVGR